MNFSDFDYRIMKKVHSLALNGKGSVEPNPVVGAVIIKNGTIIGKGYHKKFGGAHAEIEAIKNCKNSPKNGTIYVNLEPCCFFGKTPACTDALIKAGIKKVIISNIDPNTKVNGKGLKILKKAGIEVYKGLMEEEGKKLNEVYFKYISSKIPFVTLKAALSVNGKIYHKDQKKYFSSLKSRKFTHKLRSENQAILVGKNTVLTDNPHLGARLFKGKDPIRIILDSNLQTPLSSKIFRNGKAIIFTKVDKSKKREEIENKGCSVEVSKSMNIKNILKKVGKIGISNVLVEGGSEIFSSLIKENLVDKYIFFLTPNIFPEKDSLTVFSNNQTQKKLRFANIKKIDKDIYIEAYNN